MNIFLDTNKIFISHVLSWQYCKSSKPDRGKARKNFLAFLKVMGLLWVECKLAFLSSITYKKRYSNEFLKAKQSRYVGDKSPDLPVYDFVLTVVRVSLSRLNVLMARSTNGGSSCLLKSGSNPLRQLRLHKQHTYTLHHDTR